MASKTRKPAAPASQPDDSSPAERHRLEGLEPDNLLAVMTLLGLLRALETARPAWRPRAFWEVATHPWRPVLTLAEPQTEAAVAEAVAEGVRVLARHHATTGYHDDLKLSLSVFDALRWEATAQEQCVLDALCCHAAARDDGTLWPTPFAFMFGQGHQHFLTRFRNVPNELSDANSIADTLFGPWAREDRTDGFRWDPAEDRRYALRALNPSTDKATTQHGANVLAAIALPLLAVVPIRRRGETRVLAPMTRYGIGGQIEFTWPVWTGQARLAAVLALMQHPELASESPRAAKIPQTAVLMRARRISVGKYFNVTPGAPPP